MLVPGLVFEFSWECVFKKAGVDIVGCCWGCRRRWSPSDLLRLQAGLVRFRFHCVKMQRGCFPISETFQVLHSSFSCLPWIYLFSWERVVSCSMSEWKSYSLEQKVLKMKLLIVTAGDFFFFCALLPTESIFKLSSEVWEDLYLLSAPPRVREAVTQLFTIISTFWWVGRC